MTEGFISQTGTHKHVGGGGAVASNLQGDHSGCFEGFCWHQNKCSVLVYGPYTFDVSKTFETT